MGFRPRVADDLRTMDRAPLRRPGRWASPPTSRRAPMSEPRSSSSSGRVARLELVNPPLNLVTQELLDELGVALATARGRRARRRPGGRRDRARASGRSRPARTSASSRRSAGRRGRARHELESRRRPTPGRAADADHRRDRGQRPGRRAGARAVLRPADRLGAGAGSGLPEVRLAVTPGAGGTQRLPRVVGAARAKELILTGAVLTAAEAERIGLVNRVVPAGEAVARATAIGEEIAAARPARRPRGEAPHRPRDRRPTSTTGLAAELDASDRVFATDDMLEGAAVVLREARSGLPRPLRPTPQRGGSCHG